MAAGYRARWQGDEYPAAADPQPDELRLRLYRSGPADGFDEVAPDRFVRVVAADECEAVLHVSTVCEWQGAPFEVLDERDGELLLEYTGGLVPVAQQLELTRIERGVYRTRVPRAEVQALREDVVLLSL
jgi:hypothetical protein